jgi:hypothetical protein
MQLKRNSPGRVIEVFRTMESRADTSFNDLEIYSFPQGMASWAVLVSLVLATERAREEPGYKNYDVKLINLSIRGALALRWIQERGKDAKSEAQTFKWTPSLARAVDQALAIAAKYLVFSDCFSMWHQDREFAELLSESVARFTAPGGMSARRVSAFQKGFRPVSSPAQDEGLVLSPAQAQDRDAAFSPCFYAGHLAMAYPEPIEFYNSLFPSYFGRLDAMFRRADSLDLGPYTMGELKRAYAAFTTVLSAHEDFCYRFGVRHQYPVNSCVMMQTSDQWAKLLARIARLEEPKCSAIVEDLTLRDRYWDLHVEPFITVGDNVLAVAPQFPLHSRADENILRVCNHRRDSYFAKAAQMKEQEMLDDLLPRCPKNVSASVRISLPNRLGDIDLLLVDEEAKAVIVAELKWFRKPSSQWKERIHREEDFGKGSQKLSEIRTFLLENPSFLSARGKLKRPLNEYQRVAFVLVARDFFLWLDSHDLILADYEVFKEAVVKTADLAGLIDKLRAYEWLPVEGKDFRVAFEPVGLNGVTIESEKFYRI